jgi:hypothetical protein
MLIATSKERPEPFRESILIEGMVLDLGIANSPP